MLRYHRKEVAAVPVRPCRVAGVLQAEDIRNEMDDEDRTDRRTVCEDLKSFSPSRTLAALTPSLPSPADSFPVSRIHTGTDAYMHVHKQARVHVLR